MLPSASARGGKTGPQRWARVVMLMDAHWTAPPPIRCTGVIGGGGGGSLDRCYSFGGCQAEIEKDMLQPPL